MGSIEDEQLVQMVNDYIESADHHQSSAVSYSEKTSSLRHPLQLPLMEVLKKGSDDEEKEIEEKILSYVKETGNQKEKVIKNLRNNGYEASLCKTTWNSTFSCSEGNYDYIEAMVVKNGEARRVIVDVDFRSQFEVARPTKAYKELISNLPSVFVGTEEKLNKIITMLGPACKKSLKEKGLSIPPWRRTSYMQSKWFSKNCKKVSVSSSDDADLGIVDQNKKEEEGEKGNSTITTCCPLRF